MALQRLDSYYPPSLPLHRSAPMYPFPASTPLPIRPVLSRQDIFRSHLADVRHHYQALLATISEAEWRMPSKATKWTVGELLVHLYLRLATIPAAINGI